MLAFTLSAMLLSGCKSNRPCTVPLKQSPELRGFRLGMSLADIQQRLSGFPSVSANQIGVATVEISNDYLHNALDRRYVRGPVGDIEDVVSFISAAPFPAFKEVKHVELELLDGKLIKIGIYYRDDVKWKSGGEFRQKTAEALKLDGDWDTKDGNSGSMLCNVVAKDEGFSVHAGLGKPPREAILRDSELENPARSLFAAIDRPLDTSPYVELADFWSAYIAVFDREQQAKEKAKRDEEREEQERKRTFKP